MLVYHGTISAITSMLVPTCHHYLPLTALSYQARCLSKLSPWSLNISVRYARPSAAARGLTSHRLIDLLRYDPVCLYVTKVSVSISFDYICSILKKINTAFVKKMDKIQQYVVDVDAFARIHLSRGFVRGLSGSQGRLSGG